MHQESVAMQHKGFKRDILLVPGIVFSTRDIDDAMHDMCNYQC